MSAIIEVSDELHDKIERAIRDAAREFGPKHIAGEVRESWLPELVKKVGETIDLDIADRVDFDTALIIALGNLRHRFAGWFYPRRAHPSRGRAMSILAQPKIIIEPCFVAPARDLPDGDE